MSSGARPSRFRRVGRSKTSRSAWHPLTRSGLRRKRRPRLGLLARSRRTPEQSDDFAARSRAGRLTGKTPGARAGPPRGAQFAQSLESGRLMRTAAAKIDGAVATSERSRHGRRCPNGELARVLDRMRANQRTLPAEDARGYRQAAVEVGESGCVVPRRIRPADNRALLARDASAGGERRSPGPASYCASISRRKCRCDEDIADETDPVSRTLS